MTARLSEESENEPSSEMAKHRRTQSCTNQFSENEMYCKLDVVSLPDANSLRNVTCPPTGEPLDVVQPGEPLGVAQPGEPLGVAQPGEPLGVAQTGEPLNVVQPGEPLGVAQTGEPLENGVNHAFTETKGIAMPLIYTLKDLDSSSDVSIDEKAECSFSSDSESCDIVVPLHSSSTGVQSSIDSMSNQGELVYTNMQQHSVRGDIATFDMKCGAWKVRTNRSALATFGTCKTWGEAIKSWILPDVAFALGPYEYGGLYGKPTDREPSSRNSLVARIVADLHKEGISLNRSVNHGVKHEHQGKGMEHHKANRDELVVTQEDESKQVRKLLHRMAENTDIKYIRFLGWILGKAWNLLFSRVTVDAEGIGHARSAYAHAHSEKCGTLLLPTHRSHVDYLLMSYVSFGFNLPIPVIAAGNNLQMPVVGHIFHRAGAFFIRRTFGSDRGYSLAIHHYLLSQFQSGAAVEAFVQGGRTRTGFIGPPKLGLLQMVAKMVMDGEIADVLLLPAAVDYDLVPESRGYAEMVLGKPKKPESFRGVLRTIHALVTDWLSGSQPPRGCVMTNFARHRSLRELVDQCGEGATPREVAQAVGREVVTAQRAASVVSPVAVCAALLLDSNCVPGGLVPLTKRFDWLIGFLRTVAGARVSIPMDLVGVEVSQVVDDSLGVLQTIVLQDGGELQEPELLRRTRIHQPMERASTLGVVQRLQLSYSMGELPPTLAAYAAVAAGLQSEARSAHFHSLSPRRHFVASVSSVLSRAKAAGEVLSCFYSYCAVDEVSLLEAFEHLHGAGCLQLLHNRPSQEPLVVYPTSEPLARMKFFHSLGNVAFHAVYAVAQVLLAIRATSEDDSFLFEDLKKLVRSLSFCKNAMYDQMPCEVQSEEVIKSAVQFMIHREVLESKLWGQPAKNSKAKKGYRILGETCKLLDIVVELKLFCRMDKPLVVLRPSSLHPQRDQEPTVDICRDVLLSPLFQTWQ